MIETNDLISFRKLYTNSSGELIGSLTDNDVDTLFEELRSTMGFNSKLLVKSKSVRRTNVSKPASVSKLTATIGSKYIRNLSNTGKYLHSQSDYMNPNVKTIGINTALPVILIDTSIFQFTVVLQKAKKRYKKEYANSDEHTTKDSSEHFMQIFKDTFVDEINKYALKYGTVKSNILLCNDTPRDMVWRRQIDPTYKLHRELKDNDIEKIESNKVYNAFWRQYTTMNQPMHVIELQRLESDDIVYLICKRLEKVTTRL